MIDIAKILTYVYNGVKADDPRFVVEDDEHVLDTKTSIEYHLYDDGGKVTYGDKVVARLEFYRKNEQDILMAIKKLITDPKVMEQKIAHYPVMVKEAREAFADYYENPRPIVNKEPVAEENTTDYQG